MLDTVQNLAHNKQPCPGALSRVTLIQDLRNIIQCRGDKITYPRFDTDIRPGDTSGGGRKRRLLPALLSPLTKWFSTSADHSERRNLSDHDFTAQKTERQHFPPSPHLPVTKEGQHKTHTPPISLTAIPSPITPSTSKRQQLITNMFPTPPLQVPTSSPPNVQSTSTLES